MLLTRVLKNGAIGGDVYELQLLLAASGYYVMPDAEFGDLTEHAVKEFQKAKGLDIDGKVGAITWKALGGEASRTVAPSGSVQELFIGIIGPMAKASMVKTGVPSSVTIAQAILESGWGKHAPGNNYFGIMANSRYGGLKQLLTTTEILPSKKYKFPEIISIAERPDGRFEYVVKDWFRAYNSAEDCFNDHGMFLKSNSRYAKAFNFSHNGQAFALEVAAAGYASAPNYPAILLSLINNYNLTRFDN